MMMKSEAQLEFTAQKVILSTEKSLSLGLFACLLLIPPTQASNYDIAFFIFCSLL